MRNYKVRISYKAKDDDAEKLDELAKQLGTTKSEAIRRAVSLAFDYMMDGWGDESKL